MAVAADATGVRETDQRDVVAWLAAGTGIGGAAPRRIDTHAAHIFLTADRAWKLKRAVAYPYLDYSTPDRRREALEAELSLNRRTAPDLYRAVRPVTRDAAGRLALDGNGDAVDWLLEMDRFPDGALLAECAASLDSATLLALSDRIVALHASEPAVRRDGAARVRRVIDGNARSFAAVSGTFDPELVLAVEDAQRAELERHAGQLDLRARSGRVRRGHGDLHLANIALIDGVATPFDCIEFSEDLATNDVLYDLAFAVMDLWRRGLSVQAGMLANRYLDIAPQGAGGYALLPLFVSLRAAVRAHVLAAQAERTGDQGTRDEARRHLAAAAEALAPAPARLVAIGGLSGTGKTTLARMLGGILGRPPGARVLRSDVFRKRLAGVTPETQLPPSRYTVHTNAETYEALFESAEDHLRCGTSVILDAALLSRSERDVAAMIAARAGVSFTGIWLEAPERDRVARIAARTGDASDADAQVAREQGRRSVGDLGGWHRMRANRPMEMIVPAARAAIERVRR